MSKSLRKLNLYRCTNSTGHEYLSHIAILNLSCCPIRCDLSAFKGAEELDFAWCDSITDLSGLSSLSHLRKLNLSFCHQLPTLHSLTSPTSICCDSWPAIEDLNLWGCKITDINAITILKNLRRLRLNSCGKITDITPLAVDDGLSRLKILSLAFCDLIEDIGPLAHLSDLQKLDLSYCTGIKDFSPLGDLESLQKVNLTSTGISWRRGLGGLKRCRQIRLQNCSQIKDVEGFQYFTCLEKLDLSECHHIKDITPLGELKSLKELDIRGCRHLENVDTVTHVQDLNVIKEYVRL
jgi:internalin A